MSDQKTVKIPAQGAELESWLGLADISDLVPQGWSLAGGSMMRLLACERGYEGSRQPEILTLFLIFALDVGLLGNSSTHSRAQDSSLMGITLPGKTTDGCEA